VYGFEKLKDIPLHDLEHQIEELSLVFNEEAILHYCKVRPNIGKIDLINSGKVDEAKYQAELENVKTGTKADFSAVGDFSNRFIEVARLLVDNMTLESLHLKNCGLNDAGGTEIFKALQENMYLTTLDISGN
jgi:hypothetical protein